MEYLIPLMLVLLLVAGVVTFMVLNATKQSKPSEAQNSEDSDPKTMAATDPSPLGDTTEHAGDQSRGRATTVEDARGRQRRRAWWRARRASTAAPAHADTRERHAPRSRERRRQRRSTLGLTPRFPGGDRTIVAPLPAGATRPSSS